MTEQLIEGKRRSTGSRGIDEINKRNLRTIKLEERENLRRILYVYRKHMNAMPGLAGPTTPGLFMCLLVMCTMVGVHGEALGESCADEEKAETEDDRASFVEKWGFAGWCDG
jgi:hypothetical protein